MHFLQKVVHNIINFNLIIWVEILTLITGEKHFEDHHILSKVTFYTYHSVEYIKHTSDFSLAEEHTQNCLLTAEICTLSTKTIPKITQDIRSSRVSPTDSLK